jgi:hypothetical protein
MLEGRGTHQVKAEWRVEADLKGEWSGGPRGANWIRRDPGRAGRFWQAERLLLNIYWMFSLCYEVQQAEMKGEEARGPKSLSKSSGRVIGTLVDISDG